MKKKTATEKENKIAWIHSRKLHKHFLEDSYSYSFRNYS